MILVFGPTKKRKRCIQQTLAPDQYQGVEGASERDNALVACGSGDCYVSVQAYATQGHYNRYTWYHADESITLQMKM